MARLRIGPATGNGQPLEVYDSALPFFPGYVVLEVLDPGFGEVDVYPSRAEMDTRYVNSSDVGNPATPDGAALRAAFVSRAPAPTGVAATDTVNLLAAAAEVVAAGGGVILLRAGTYLVNQPVPVSTNVVWRGQGRSGATIIKVADGANCDAFLSDGFATLTGTNVASLTASPYGFSIENLTVDGNKANQTGISWGVRLFGHSFRMDEVHIRNCLSGGLYNEFGYSGQLVADVGLPSYEPRLSNVDIHHCNGWGWRHRGPTDLLASRVLVWRCGTDGASGGIWLQRGNGTSLTQCHTYGNVGWSIVTDVQAFITGCQIETGEKGNGNLDAGGLWIRFDDCVVSGGAIYRISAGGTPQDGIGLRLGDLANNKYAVRPFVNTSILGFTASDADHAAIHFNGDAASTVYATVGINNPSGAAAATTPFAGTPDVGSRLQIHVSGSSSVKALTQNMGTSTVGVKAVRTTDVSNVPSGVFTAIGFDAPDVWDTNGFHDPAANNTRITIPAGFGGKYRLQAGFPWAANTTGRRSIRIKKNGTTTIVAREDKGATSSGPTCLSVSVDVLANPTDYFEIEVVHDTGGQLSSDIASGPVYFSAEYRG